MAYSLDHIGPIARTAADAGALLGAIAGLDPDDPTTLPASVPNYPESLDRRLGRVRIGVDAGLESQVDPAIAAALAEGREVLESEGASVRNVCLPDLSTVTGAWATLCAVEAAIAHSDTYPAQAERYGALAGLLESGRALSGQDALRAHHDRLWFAGALAPLFTDVDLLLVPTQPASDFSLADEGALFATPEGLASFVRFAAPFDMSGNPTITESIRRARGSATSPSAVSVTPFELRSNSRPPSSRSSIATARLTPGCVIESRAPAAAKPPSSATATNALSCASVMTAHAELAFDNRTTRP